jgi:hypothetical protein
MRNSTAQAGNPEEISIKKSARAVRLMIGIHNGGMNYGKLFFSRNNGDSWELLAARRPPILSLETAMV